MKPHFKVSLFSCKKSIIPARCVDIWEWLLQRNECTSIIERSRKTNDNKEYKRLKSSLPAITPSGIFHKRNANSLTKPSNLICIDIDGKDNPSISDVEELKERLGKLPYVMYCGLSASGKGVFCIIPYEDYKKHKLYFNALEQEFKDMGVVVDSSCSDICRLRFYSYDEHPYINPDAETYTRTLEKGNTAVSRPRQQQVFKSRGVIPRKKPKELSVEEALLQPSNLDFASATPLTKTQEVERLLNVVIDKQIDITEQYNDWIAVCYIIKNLFGDEGIDLFHQASSFYPNYDYEETEQLYLSAIRNKYHYNTDRLFEIAAKYGIYK